MSIPLRNYLSPVNLFRRGVAKKYHEVSLEDSFLTYGNESLQTVKKTVQNYISNLEDMKRKNTGILFYGSNGSGKSHLASYIVKEAYRHRFTSKRCTFAEYVEEYTKVWGVKSHDEKEQVNGLFYHNFKAVEFLVLEEIGKEIDSKISIPILEDCLRYREEKGLVTIICSNSKPSVLFEKYGSSISSLLQGNCLPIKMESEDQRKNVFEERLNYDGE